MDTNMHTSDEKMPITLNNVIKVLQSVLNVDYEITENTEFMALCSDDMNKVSLVCERVKRNFDVEIGFGDIRAVNTVEDMFQLVYEKRKSPKLTYLATARDTRRNDLSDIVSKNKLFELDSSLSEAKSQLETSLRNIKNCSTPLDQLGYNVKYGWLKKFLNTVDPKVNRDELIKVLTAVDGNTKDGFGNISKAIEATNGCIDAISKLMLLIIQIENDLYNTADETTEGISAISEELLREGVNVEGLSRIAEHEREKRLRIQAKMREFKDDVYGKIDFLNKVNLNLKTEFVTCQDNLDKLFEKANSQLNTNFENVKSTIDANLQEQNSIMKSLQEKYSLAERSLTDRFSRLASELSSKVDSLQEETHQQLSKVGEEQKQSIVVMQNEIKQVILDWDNERKAHTKKIKWLVVIVSFVAIVETVVLLLF